MSIDKKLDDIKDDVNEIKTHLAVYNEQLKVHIKGVQILDKRLIPVEKHVIMINAAVRLISILAAVAALVEICDKLL